MRVLCVFRESWLGEGEAVGYVSSLAETTSTGPAGDGAGTGDRWFLASASDLIRIIGPTDPGTVHFPLVPKGRIVHAVSPVLREGALSTRRGTVLGDWHHLPGLVAVIFGITGNPAALLGALVTKGGVVVAVFALVVVVAILIDIDILIILVLVGQFRREHMAYRCDLVAVRSEFSPPEEFPPVQKQAVGSPPGRATDPVPILVKEGKLVGLTAIDAYQVVVGLVVGKGSSSLGGDDDDGLGVGFSFPNELPGGIERVGIGDEGDFEADLVLRAAIDRGLPLLVVVAVAVVIVLLEIDVENRFLVVVGLFCHFHDEIPSALEVVLENIGTTLLELCVCCCRFCLSTLFLSFYYKKWLCNEKKISFEKIVDRSNPVLIRSL
jgi:hypothetical protein